MSRWLRSAAGAPELAALAALPLVALLALQVGACGQAGDDRRPAGERPDLVVYLIDTLRADHLGCYGYPLELTPEIDAFAREATLFEDAIAQSSWTRASVASLFTGLLPTEHGANRRRQPLAPEAVTLAERLGRAGYRTVAFVTNPNVGVEFGFDQGFDEFVYREAESAEELNRLVAGWLDERRAAGDDAPFFLYVHTLEPHSPYEPPPEHRRRWAPDVPEPGPSRPNRWIDEARADEVDVELLVSRMEALYDAEIAAADEAFGAFLDLLRERGLYGDAVVALLSDHGEEFFEHRSFEHGKGVFEEVLRVPMIVRWGDAGPEGRVPEPVQHLDLFHTLLEAAGALEAAKAPESPAARGGARSLLAIARGRPDAAAGPRSLFSYLHLDGRPRASLRQERTKLIVARAGERLIHPRLYDLDADPGETDNLAEGDPRRVERMRGRIVRFLALEEHGLRGTPVDIDEDLQKRLEALGYL